jgi:hypothetical protein
VSRGAEYSRSRGVRLGPPIIKIQHHKWTLRERPAKSYSGVSLERPAATESSSWTHMATLYRCDREGERARAKSKSRRTTGCS